MPALNQYLKTDGIYPNTRREKIRGLRIPVRCDHLANEAIPATEYEIATVRRAIRILEREGDYASNAETVNCPEASKQLAFLRLGNKKDEYFAVGFLNNRHRLIAFERLFRGTVDGASVHPRVVVRRALEHNAAAVILRTTIPRARPNHPRPTDWRKGSRSRPSPISCNPTNEIAHLEVKTMKKTIAAVVLSTAATTGSADVVLTGTMGVLGEAYPYPADGIVVDAPSFLGTHVAEGVQVDAGNVIRFKYEIYDKMAQTDGYCGIFPFFNYDGNFIWHGPVGDGHEIYVKAERAELLARLCIFGGVALSEPGPVVLSSVLVDDPQNEYETSESHDPNDPFTLYGPEYLESLQGYIEMFVVGPYY